jgi:hypothetical protein
MPDYLAAVNILRDMLKIIGNELNAYVNESPARMVDDIERDIAIQAVHLNGSLGGVYRRWGKIHEAIEAYATGAKIEENTRYKLKETYTSTQHMVVRCLAKPDLIAEAGLIEGSAIRTELIDLRRRIARLSHGDVYKTADLAIVSLLLRHSEWRRDLMDFVTMAKNRSEDYARQVTLEVVQELDRGMNSLKADHRDQLLHWDEAKRLLV